MDAGRGHIATTDSLLRQVQAEARLRKCLRLAIAVCAVTFLLQIVRWPLVNLLTPFFEPLLEGCVYLALLGVSAFTGIQGIRLRRHSRSAFASFAVCISTWVILFAVPFDALYLSINFHLYRSRRTTAARAILSSPQGQSPNAGGRGTMIDLPSPQSGLSIDGVVLVDHRDDGAFVLFFTYRGVLDRFSGFVYSPTDKPPAKDEFLGDGVEIQRVAPNWFWYAS